MKKLFDIYLNIYIYTYWDWILDISQDKSISVLWKDSNLCFTLIDIDTGIRIKTHTKKQNKKNFDSNVKIRIFVVSVQ
jgi:hypothetical protein